MVEIRVAETDEEVQACLDLVSSLYPNRAMLLEEVREIEAAVPDQARFQALEEGRIVGTASIMAEPRGCGSGGERTRASSPRATSAGEGSAPGSTARCPSGLARANSRSSRPP